MNSIIQVGMDAEGSNTVIFDFYHKDILNNLHA